ncbi:MAG: MATE family efflux transporter [Cyanobacteria bacterium HKST-UBA02]|nr:MATE family efflux transporter [Cyanobacteria bacterium HKST-UBA02]
MTDQEHSFIARPNRTLIALALPVLVSMIAEPLTGLVDTAFVAKLGAASLAGLGVGTITLSSVLWIFNFLGIGSQTQVAQSWGGNDQGRASVLSGQALLLALAFGMAVAIPGILLSSQAAALMGASGEVLENARTYMNIRFLAAPAVLISATAFGVLRGLQDMRTPMKVALAINILNVALDPVLIFGFGPLPALGIAGAALATIASQWFGAAWCLFAVFKNLGAPKGLDLSEATALIRVGGDLFIRTGLLTTFLLLTTRAATEAGADTGAAHQAIRQVWIFTALFLDSFAITGQSLVGFFIGAGNLEQARRVASYVFAWSVGTGALLALAMLSTTGAVMNLLVPPSSRSIFPEAWFLASVAQPLNALAFATDGVHWGTGDFAFLRNVMILATTTGVCLLYLSGAGNGLTAIWIITAFWISIRAAFGVLRVFPGLGKSPLKGKTV